jgi:hypothetical protein
MALTTHGRGEHAVRGDRWRYIRYHDGTEELYDHESDPMEWKNLADRSEHDQLKEQMARWIPMKEAREAKRRGGGQVKRNRRAAE